MRPIEAPSGEVGVAPARRPAGPADPRRSTAAGRRDLTTIAVGATVLAGVVLRFSARSSLWLDEAISVDIARLPLDAIPAALRHDGHPPLYYFLLHVWTSVFGTGDTSARALSAAFAIATLPLVWAAGRRLGGGRTAIVAVLFLASSPYGVRYGTEARMYSMLSFLALAGFLAGWRALERPVPGRLVLLAAISGGLLLTHYWSFYLVAGGVAVVGVISWRGPARRGAALRVMAAMAAGGLCFLPWVGSFLDQARHTGTPWGRSVMPRSDMTDTLLAFAGGHWSIGWLLGLLLVILAAAGLVSRSSRASAAVVIGLAGTTMVAGLVAGMLASSTYQTRYAAVVFPFVVLAAAVGAAGVSHAGARTVLLGAVVVGGLVGSVRSDLTPRTQGRDVAEAVNSRARTGDVVAYCPDQLEPSVHRTLTRSVAEMTFPAGSPPGRVDWVDYSDRIRSSDVGRFARSVLAAAGPDHTVFLVTSPRYRGFGDSCERALAAIGADRGPGQRVVRADHRSRERHDLTVFPAR